MTQIEKMQRIEELVKELNLYRESYYNKSISLITDFDYDNLMDELKQLEEETGYLMADSPNRTVGYKVNGKLPEVAHNHPMLSLDKTKNINDIHKFLSGHKAVCMAKMDGLTVSLKYINGTLMGAETRGNGHVGNLVTHNAQVIDSIPKYINTLEHEVIIDGEVIVRKSDFAAINEGLPEEEKYKHPRNFASGSINKLDSAECAERKLMFIAWRCVKGCNSNSFMDRWKFMSNLKFRCVPIVPVVENADVEMLQKCTESMQTWAEQDSYPIDGCVFGFDDIAYGESLGATSHHLNSQIAFKFYDETKSTKLIDIDWTIGKTGVLTPTAVFEEVELDGTSVTRASLHNISIMRELKLTKNCTISVYKANQIIPQVDCCEVDGDGEIEIPEVCPICGAITEIRRENDSEVLICTNENCAGKMLMKFKNFVSRNCADIEGLNDATLSEFISKGYLHTYKDIYHLSDFAEEIKTLEGFGEKSVNKLLASIEKSRNIKLENYIAAVGIDGIGVANGKVISNHFNGDYEKFEEALNKHFDFQQLEGFGVQLQWAIYRWWQKDTLHEDLAKEFNFEKVIVPTDDSLGGLRFCITGSFNESREVLKEKLESKGAIFVSGVSKKLDVLFVGENAGSKLDKAKELGVRIADEKELLEMIK